MRASVRVALVAAAIAVLPATGARAQVATAAADCVAFGKPKPTMTYLYRRSDPDAPVTQYSHRWTEFTAERASVVVVRGKVNEAVTNKYRIQDDVSMIAATASRTSTSSSRTDFRPALMGEPMFRPCAGRFECARYTRTLATPTGPSLDEYWKSIEHGVVVKQVSKVGGWASTTELTAIR